MAAEPSLDQVPSSPGDYQYKGALQHLNNTWVVLYHCRPLERDVVVKIKQIPDFLEDWGDYVEKVNPMLRLRHNNLLTPIGAFTAGSDLWMVYPRHSGGPLQEIISTNFHRGIDEGPIVARILSDVLDGLEYMHNDNVCHRNLRAENLHVARETGRIMLTEFGDLKAFESTYASGRQTTHSIRGQVVPYWLAPEIILQDELGPKDLLKADIYSFGMTALEIILGQPPSNPWNQTAVGLQLRPVTFEACGRDCPFPRIQQTIEDCLKPTPSERPTAAGLKKSLKGFFASACTREVLASRLGLLTRTTEQRINNNLFPPKNITLMEVTPDSVMTPHVSDTIQHSFADADLEKLKEMDGRRDTLGVVGELDQSPGRDSEWDFSSTQLNSEEIEEMKRNAAASSMPTTPVADEFEPRDSTDDMERQKSAGRFFIEKSDARNSGASTSTARMRIEVGHRRSLSDSRPPRRTNSDFSDFGDPVSPQLSMQDDYSRDSVSPTKNHRRSYSENNVASPNEQQVGRFFVSTDRNSARHSESALSGSESATTTPRIQIQDDLSLSSSMDTIEECHSHLYDISDHTENVMAVSRMEGLGGTALRPPRDEPLSESSDGERGEEDSVQSNSSNKMELGRFNVEFSGHSPSTSEVPPTTDPPPQQDLPPPAEEEKEESADDLRSRLPDLEEEFYLRFPKWTEEDCARFIASFGKIYAEQVNETMAEHGIDGEMFDSLTEEDLSAMGITTQLYRKKILNMQGRLKKYVELRKKEINAGRARNGSTKQREGETPPE